MDDELRRLLTDIREENAAAHAETRQSVDRSLSEMRQENAQMRQENAAAHVETRQYVDRSLSEMRQGNAQMRQENAAAHVETRQYVDRSLAEMRQENAAAHVETRHQFGVIAESLQHKIEFVIEGLATNNERLERLEVKFDRITDDLDTRLTRLEAASFRSGR